MLTSEQMRAARSLLRWEQTELAENSGISVETIRRLEAMTGELKGRYETIQSVKNAFESAGLEFIDPPETVATLNRKERYRGSGVRFSPNPNERYLRLVANAVKSATELSLLLEIERDPEIFKKGPHHVSGILLRGYQAWLEDRLTAEFKGSAFKPSDISDAVGFTHQGDEE
ncbi:helix-turn-helix domain-containing protein [Neorhizobium galegae]|uniref:helix-turn-helix domain-containing protein n=1 Tax=Neorhizobium galegae TaxID=399 RepID=UPI0021062E82|nr:helix-turn-helix transcriptional regulator [Neorhizobium galegae]MCQ1766147.1 helix-turn-helix domain-containing protein [Neorhizobium galegae]MCQ1845061.1 helix-turn-helix domain-containing protein [Neorhizobium galegae]